MNPPSPHLAARQPFGFRPAGASGQANPGGNTRRNIPPVQERPDLLGLKVSHLCFIKLQSPYLSGRVYRFTAPCRQSPAKLNRESGDVNQPKAFDRLLQITERCNGESRIVEIFPMSLIRDNGYQFNLTELRGLEVKIFNDCISALRMDYITDPEAGKP